MKKYVGASQLQDLEGFMNPFQIILIGFVVAGGGSISYYNHRSFEFKNSRSKMLSQNGKGSKFLNFLFYTWL